MIGILRFLRATVWVAGLFSVLQAFVICIRFLFVSGDSSSVLNVFSDIVCVLMAIVLIKLIDKQIVFERSYKERDDNAASNH